LPKIIGKANPQIVTLAPIIDVNAPFTGRVSRNCCAEIRVDATLAHG